MRASSFYRVHPRIPRRLDDELIAAGRKKGGIYIILDMMKGNIDKIELQLKGLSILSGHVTIGTLKMRIVENLVAYYDALY